MAGVDHLDAAWQKLTSADPKLGFFAAANDLAVKLAMVCCR